MRFSCVIDVHSHCMRASFHLHTIRGERLSFFDSRCFFVLTFSVFSCLLPLLTLTLSKWTTPRQITLRLRQLEVLLFGRIYSSHTTMQNPDSKAPVVKNMEKTGENSGMAPDESQKQKKKVIEEARCKGGKVHFRSLLNSVTLRILDFFWSQEEWLLRASGKPDAESFFCSYDMEGHAKKCVWRYCEFSKKTTRQLYKVATPCLDDHQFKDDNESVGGLSTVCSHIVLICLYLARIGSFDFWMVLCITLFVRSQNV